MLPCRRKYTPMKLHCANEIFTTAVVPVCFLGQGHLNGDNAPHPIEPRWRTPAALLLLEGRSPPRRRLAGRSQARGLPSSRCPGVRGHIWSRSAHLAGRSQARGLPSSRCSSVRRHTWSRSARLASAHPIAAQSGASNCGFQVQPHEAKDGTERRPQEPCFPCCGDLNSRGLTAHRPKNDMRTNDMKSRAAGAAVPRRSRPSSAPTAPTGAPADGETHGRKGVQKVRPFGACCTRGRHHGLCRRRRPGSRARKHRCAARAERCLHLTWRVSAGRTAREGQPSSMGALGDSLRVWGSNCR